MKTRKVRRPVLRRYTSIPSLLHILHNQKITLLSPELWVDRNDAFYMRQYKERKKVKSVLALCFTEATETFHHWRVFTQGSDGACIVFDREKFLIGIGSSVQKRGMDYRPLGNVEKSPPSVDDLPFVKRLAYKDEKEYRLVYVNRRQEIDTKEIAIDLECIEWITLSPWMPQSLREAVEDVIHSIDEECEKIRVRKSGLLENERWKNAAIRP